MLKLEGILQAFRTGCYLILKGKFPLSFVCQRNKKEIFFPKIASTEKDAQGKQFPWS